ncbi:MAG: hypothetical protein J6Q39_03655 [Bacteroidales bacterium]|nr:hypothetical protein [Bacteroidales bacterium]
MGKKGFLLIDGSKNCVILSIEEIKGTCIQDLLMKNDIMARVKQNKTKGDLNKCISEYLNGGWSDEPIIDEKTEWECEA